MAKELQTDVLIVGGGVGGCAAAEAVCRTGRRAILTEQTDWIGGQLTSQAVPPDEHGWIEQFGCTASYRRFRDAVRDYYRNHRPLTAEARAQKYFNPGDGWVSPLCHEPRVALAVLQGILAPYIGSGHLTILLDHRAIASATGPNDRVAAVTLENPPSGGQCTVKAEYVLDATELGDLLPLCGVEHVTGSESRRQTGEPDAPEEGDPTNSQAFSVCFAIDHRSGENHTIDRPLEYDFWRDYQPKLTPSWPGKLLSWTASNPRTLQPIRYNFDPQGEQPKAFSGLWTYRRILARHHLAPAAAGGDICLVNWPMHDCLLGDLLSGGEKERQGHIDKAKQLSLSLLYWLQTEAPRPDGGLGFPGLRLRPDVVGSADGLAKFPYIRESRRIRAEFTICQQHVAAGRRSGQNRAEKFDDSVGVGYYRIDLHPSVGGDNYIDVPALPFQIPLGAMIPVRMENLLPAAKNLGTTHITNGCYRLHPVEWNIGEAAGSLVCFCMDRKTSPRAVCHDALQLREFQGELVKQGVELAWPADIRLESGDPHVHAM